MDAVSESYAFAHIPARGIMELTGTPLGKLREIFHGPLFGKNLINVFSAPRPALRSEGLDLIGRMRPLITNFWRLSVL